MVEGVQKERRKSGILKMSKMSSEHVAAQADHIKFDEEGI